MKIKYSGKDSRGKIYIDCSECKKGGNGEQTCSSGHKIKKGNQGMCFLGKLLEKYEKTN